MEPAFYNSLREELYTQIENYCKNVIKLDNKFKFVWLMTTENTFLVENLGHFLLLGV
jgi:predicted ATPase